MMNSMISIDNGVSKKAMAEVAEVAISLFQAADENSVSSDNLGLALKLIGKTIKTGKITISNCNLSTTLERKDDTPTGAQFGETTSGKVGPFMHEEHVYRKIERLRELAQARGITFNAYAKFVAMAKDGVEATVDIAELNGTDYDELEKWVPEIL